MKSVRLAKLNAFRKEALWFYVMLLPLIICFFAFKLFPLLWGLYISFTNYTGFNGDNIKFVGIKNYLTVFTDTEAIHAFKRTALITVILVPLSMLIVNLLALLLTRRIRFVGLFRTIFYLPAIVPTVAAGLLWQKLYSTNGGIFNLILNQFGIQGIEWLGYNWITFSFCFMVLWGTGSGLLITMAAYKNVPVDYYEAAEIDGAGSLNKFINITLPMVTPINLYNLIMGIVGTIQILGPVILLSPNVEAGGLATIPPGPIYVIISHIYSQVFGMLRFGYGMALVAVLFVIILAISLLVLKSSNSWVYYEVEQGGDNKG